MNLLTKLRQRDRGPVTSGNGVSHVRVVRDRPRTTARSRYVVTAAESAPCTCPEFCERDHENE